MATKINIIITENTIYATYVKTICFKSYFNDEYQFNDEIIKAQHTAFSYALNFGSVILNKIYKPNFKTDEDIFNYLETI